MWDPQRLTTRQASTALFSLRPISEVQTFFQQLFTPSNAFRAADVRERPLQALVLHHALQQKVARGRFRVQTADLAICASMSLHGQGARIGELPPAPGGQVTRSQIRPRNDSGRSHKTEAMNVRLLASDIDVRAIDCSGAS
jgi:hypothetical protein